MPSDIEERRLRRNAASPPDLAAVSPMGLRRFHFVSIRFHFVEGAKFEEWGRAMADGDGVVDEGNGGV